MPSEAVWVMVTIPKKEHEMHIKQLRRRNLLNIEDELMESMKKDKQEISMEKVLEEALEHLGIEDVVWVPTRNDNFFQVYFPCDLYENDSILQFLQSKGIGTKSETSIGYIPFGLFYYDEFGESDEETNQHSYNHSMPGELDDNKFDIHKKVNGFKETTQNFLKSITSRLTVAQVVDGVRSGADLTFDFVCYTIFAGWIAAMGLINNSPVDIAAAMMIEPIMGTVMAITFGAVIEDRSLFNIGIKSNIISLLICILIGYIIGMITFIWMVEWNPPPNGIWPTGEMQVRGTFRGLIYGALVALPSGGAIAVTLLNDNQAALVGVAVASTFLPPFINTGLLWALTTHLQIRSLWEQIVPLNISGHIVNLKPSWAPQEGYNVIYSYDMRIENALLGCVSMALTFVNIICMLFFAYILLKIKEVAPLGKLAPGTQRFFQQDIKVARNHNRKSVALGTNETLGEQILKEWADIAGIDKNQLMNDRPEAKVTQLQTLFDIAQDVEADETYQTILRNAMGRPDQSKLSRRLTQPALLTTKQGLSRVYSTQPNIWDVDSETSQVANGRRYTVNPVEDSINRRRVSEWGPRSSNDGSQISSISPSIRGLKPNEMENRNRRGSTALLKKSLQDSLHSPYSVWPSNQLRQRSHSRLYEQNARRRTSFNPKLQAHQESTGF